MHYLTFHTVTEEPVPDIKTDIYQYYLLAGKVFQSQRKIAQLEHLNLKKKVTSKLVSNPLLEISSNKKHIIYNNNVLIGDNSFQTQVHHSEKSTYSFKFDLQKYIVKKNEIIIISPYIDPTILLGPVLITNLALNRIFCLHASAFILNNKAFVLMGESGTGKSTIAKFIGAQKQSKRLADDMLPIRIKDNNITLLPNFPQLKLAQNNQYIDDEVTKETIFLFTKKSKENTSIKPIENFSAIKKLIKHSVATKLFAKKELQNHLEFCHKACLKAKNFDVLYQHSEKGLLKLIEQLNEIH